MDKAKRAQTAETPKQPSLGLKLRAPYLYPGANLSSDPWPPTTVADKVRLPVSSPVTSAFPKFPSGRLLHINPFNDF